MSNKEAAILAENIEEITGAITDFCLNSTVRTPIRSTYEPLEKHKRDLSTGSSPSPSVLSTLDKRLRLSGPEFDCHLLTPEVAMEPNSLIEPDVTLADIMAQLRLTAKITDCDKLAKQEDLILIKTSVDSHSLEIQQLREDLKIQSKRIQDLEDAVGHQTARSLNRTQPDLPDIDVNRTRQDCGTHKVNIRSAERKQNLVFEGVPPLSETELEIYLLQLCTSLEIITFPSDIEDIVVMKRRDRESNRPPPLLVTFAQPHVRSALLRKKVDLCVIDKYKEVYINPDEPIEVRRNKATFRKIAYKVRQAGKPVRYRDNWIQIEDDVYRISDLHKLPDQYKIELNSNGKIDVSCPDQDGELRTGIAVAKSSEKIEKQLGARQRPFANPKIKLTDAGLTFYGPSAFLSHMFNCDFVFAKTPYTLVEQGLHHTHATHEMDFETAEAIMELYNAQDIKREAWNLPMTEEWKKMAPGVVWDLNDAKFSQNPDLKQKLIDTAPHKIIEASVHAGWGGGCPFGSDIYEQGQVPGINIAGNQLTKYRDDLIAEIDKYRMT